MGNGNESTVNVVQQRGISLSVIIQIATILILIGFTWASFETKADALAKSDAAAKFNRETYMPRELSLEKWSKNEDAHAEIKKALEANNKLLSELLNEARRGKTQAQGR
jgi:hypothetical protein